MARRGGGLCQTDIVNILDASSTAAARLARNNPWVGFGTLAGVAWIGSWGATNSFTEPVAPDKNRVLLREARPRVPSSAPNPRRRDAAERGDLDLYAS